MRTRFKFTIVFTMILMAAGISRGGDFATLHVIGFSNTGRYLAYEEFGTQDGSGFPYSNIYFIDTEKNAYAAPPILIQIENEDVSERTVRARSAARAAAKLKRFDIVKGVNGRLVLSHLMTDQTIPRSSEDGAKIAVRFWDQYLSFYREGDYELTLDPIKIDDEECNVYGDIYKFDLVLTNKDTNFSKYLQRDSALPKGRGCPLSYDIQDVYLYKGIIAVFINVYTQGFEGPDMRYIAVTGRLKEL